MTNGPSLASGFLLGSAPDNVSSRSCFRDEGTGYLGRAYFSSSSGEASFLRVTCGVVSKHEGRAVVGREDLDGDRKTNVEEHGCW